MASAPGSYLSFCSVLFTFRGSTESCKALQSFQRLSEERPRSTRGSRSAQAKPLGWRSEGLVGRWPPQVGLLPSTESPRPQRRFRDSSNEMVNRMLTDVNRMQESSPQASAFTVSTSCFSSAFALSTSVLRSCSKVGDTGGQGESGELAGFT